MFDAELSHVLCRFDLLSIEVLSPLHGRTQIFILSQNMYSLQIATTIVPSSLLLWLRKSLKPWSLTHCAGSSNAKVCWMTVNMNLAQVVLWAVSHSWSGVFDNHWETHLVFLDISKAFDRVWHVDLLSKLALFEFRPSLVSWVSCFLSRWTIFVRFDGGSITAVLCECWCSPRSYNWVHRFYSLYQWSPYTIVQPSLLFCPWYYSLLFSFLLYCSSSYCQYWP